VIQAGRIPKDRAAFKQGGASRNAPWLGLLVLSIRSPCRDYRRAREGLRCRAVVPLFAGECPPATGSAPNGRSPGLL
jgi:hypothetical protein